MTDKHQTLCFQCCGLIPVNLTALYRLLKLCVIFFFIYLLIVKIANSEDIGVGQMMLTSEWGLGEPRKAPSLGRKDHMHILQPVGNVSSITSLQTFQENPPKHGVFCKNF